MTKTQTIAALAERSGLSKGQVSDLLEQLASLAYTEAKNGFTLPGIGKLVLVDRKERLGRNPATIRPLGRDMGRGTSYPPRQTRPADRRRQRGPGMLPLR